MPTIDTTAINTGGAVVTLGGVIPVATRPDADGFYWGTVSGTDIGCTTGGVKVTYNFEKTDIYCDQTLAAVESAVTSETAEVTFNMLQSDVENLSQVVGLGTYAESVSEKKLALGGLTELTYTLLKLEVTDNDTSLLTTWTFFRVLSNGIEINFERDNPTQVNITMTAYADTDKAAGHQLFSIHEALV